MLLRRCALLAGVSLGAASPRHDPAFFDGTWDDRILGGGITGHQGAVAPPSCRAGLCAGAGARYPTGPGVVFESEYNIPEIPSSFGPDTSLTDYLCASGALFLPVFNALLPSSLPAPADVCSNRQPPHALNCVQRAGTSISSSTQQKRKPKADTSISSFRSSCWVDVSPTLRDPQTITRSSLGESVCTL